MTGQIEMAKIQLAQQELALKQQQQELDVQKFIREKDDKYNVDAAKIDQGQQKIDLQAQKQQFDAIMEQQKLMLEEFTAAANSMRESKAISSYKEVANMGEDESDSESDQ